MANKIEICNKRLEMWLEAEAGLATGQSYKIGTREVTRVDLAEVRRMITYWQNELEKAKNGGKRQKMLRVTPRDL